MVVVDYGSSAMDSEADVILKGESEDESFGFTVSKAGDMNGDGFDEVIVGAPGYYLNGYDVGRAYIYFGSSNMVSSADLIFTGENVRDRFGSIISDAGDINNDGYSDITIGAPRYNNIEGDPGRVYIYLGDESFNTITEANIDILGRYARSAGDINNDGFDDILISTYENSYIFLGGILIDAIADITFSGSSNMCGGGDYNNDGFADVIAGDPFDDTRGEEAGCVSLYYGSLQMDVIADALFYGERGYDSFGASLSYAGDLNRDGYSDVIVGSPLNDLGGKNAGCATIYLGGKRMNSKSNKIILGKTENGHFASSITSVGDVDGSGYPDIIIGNNSGQAWLYLDRSIYNGIGAAFTFSDGKFGSSFGSRVSGASDFNNDGYDDFMIGAHTDYVNETQTGRVYIYFGGLHMGTIPDITLRGEAKFNRFGTSMGFAGDLNNDGYSDVIIGAPGYEVDGERAGRVYIYYGNNSLDAEPDVVITGHGYQGIGRSIGRADDVNNDGYDDIVIGTPYSGAAPGGSSYVYVYYGGAEMDTTADIVFEKKSWYGFGAPVRSVGDINKDGFDDIIIGHQGSLGIYYGGIKMDTIPDIIIEREGSGSDFGSRLSLAGDVNNDGYIDILIGEPHNSAVGAQMGRAYIYSTKIINTFVSSNSTAANSFALRQNYPNPFNASTTINYSLQKPGDVVLKIYNLAGQEVEILANGFQTAGEHEITWQPQGLQSGIYFCRIKAGEFSETRKLILQK